MMASDPELHAGGTLHAALAAPLGAMEQCNAPMLLAHPLAHGGAALPNHTTVIAVNAGWARSQPGAFGASGRTAAVPLRGVPGALTPLDLRATQPHAPQRAGAHPEQRSRGTTPLPRLGARARLC